MRLFGREGISGGRCSDLLASARERELVFVVSFHKCATRTTGAILHDLGCSLMHWPIWFHSGIDYLEILRPLTRQPDLCVRALSPLFCRFDAFSDVPFPGLFRELSEVLPRSRFVLVERDARSWWKSISNHWNLKRGPHALSSFEAIQYGLPPGLKVGYDDETRLVESMLRHNSAVRDLLEKTGRLFVSGMDPSVLCSGLAAFLARKLPEGYAVPHLRESGRTWISPG